MECSFCGKEIRKGTGLIFVTKRGKALNFCSSKCEKNLVKLGRKPRETLWTKDYMEEKKIRVRGLAAQAVEADKTEKKAVESEPVEEAQAPKAEKKAAAEEKPKKKAEKAAKPKAKPKTAKKTKK